MEDRQLRDSDWATLLMAVPAFAPVWQQIVADSTYDDTLPFLNIGEMARFVAHELLVQQPDALAAIGDTLEELYTIAAIRDDEALEGLLTVGFLEDLLGAADDVGIPLTRIQPILNGRRTRDQWDRALAYRKPGFHWEDGVGAVPSAPLPLPVGTIRIHRGWGDRSAGVCRMDIRLISGVIDRGCLVRRQISKDSYTSWLVTDAALRSPDLTEEYHLTIAVERDEAFEVFEFQMSMLKFDESVWQVARPRSTADEPTA